MRWPTIYRSEGRWWHGGIDDHGNDGGRLGLLRELLWLVRHGKFRAAWQWPKLVFGGLGRTWYDGPIWFFHAGFFSVDLSAD